MDKIKFTPEHEKQFYQYFINWVFTCERITSNCHFSEKEFNTFIDKNLIKQVISKIDNAECSRITDVHAIYNNYCDEIHIYVDYNSSGDPRAYTEILVYEY
jgi:hypothetical protein